MAQTCYILCRGEELSYPSFADEDYVLAMLLRQASDAMMRARQSELTPAGVTTIEAATLMMIDSLGQNAMPARIAELVLRRPNSVSALLQRMQKDGLVRRAYDLARKNHVRMELTEYGQEVLEKVKPRESVHAVFGALSPEERAFLRKTLLRIRAEALEVLGEKAPPVPR
ncbi:MarR family winged helix-turn-helix transcriptional regulator [Chloroflexota bacterium]